MTDRELFEKALEALEQSVGTCFDQYSHHEVMSRPEHFMNRAMKALRERLAQPEQEPVAHVYLFEPNGRPRVAWDNANGIKIGDKLYTTPPQRKPLTEEEIERACVPLGAAMLSFTEVARAIEAAHGIKENT